MKLPGGCAAVLGLLFCACSNSGAVSVAGKGGGSAASGLATSVPGGMPSGPSGPPRYDRWDMSQPIQTRVECDPASNLPPLRYFLQHTGVTTDDPQQTDRAAAIVKVIAVGPNRWNTADGRRPTQAYIDALQHPTPAPDGTWPVTPNIVRSYTLQLIRAVRGTVSGSTVVGFLNGGSVGKDSIIWSGCQTAAERIEHAAPAVGHSYLVLYGPELTSPGLGAKPVQQPMIDDLIPYDPATDVLTDVTGPIKLADATKGLPPG
jgi:hypothetical protein